MVENNDQKSDSTMNSANVKLITDNKKFLEASTLSIQQEIRSSFERLIRALESREKQLLRQVEAVHVQQLSLIQSNLEVVPSKPLLNIDLSSRSDLEYQISNLGKLEVFGKNGMTVKDVEPYKVQEYQDADKDHESFNKSIKYEEKDSDIVVEKSVDVQDGNNISISTSNENTPICNDSVLSCFCNTSLNSSVDSESRSPREFSVLSVSNCTVIQKQLFASDHESHTEELGLNDTKVLLLDLTIQNSEVGFCKDSGQYNKNAETVEVATDAECVSVTQVDFYKDINSNKEQESSEDLTLNEVCANRQMRRESGEHPKQIQQWLQQILVETETEPMIHEIEQFSEISKVRLSGQFPLET